MIIATESFDSSNDDGGAAYADKWANFSAGYFTVGSTFGNPGNSATSASGVRGLQWVLPAADQDDTLIIGWDLYINTPLNETRSILQLGDGLVNNVYHIYIAHLQTKELQLYHWNGTLLATSTQQLAVDTWNYIEVKATIADAGGTVQVYVNGDHDNPWINFTGDTRNGGNANIALVEFVSVSGGHYIDNIVIMNTTDSGIPGRPNNDLLGVVEVGVLNPNGEGDSGTFNPTPNTANWENVDEASPDDDTTYVQGITTNNLDLYNFEDPGGPEDIAAAVQYTRAKSSDAGARSIALVSSLDLDEEQGADQALSGSYAWYQQAYQGAPDGTAWTIAKLTAAQFGYYDRP